MGKNRDRLCIVAAILEAANSGASKTRIMFSANLSFSLLEKYLDITIKAGFIEVSESKYVLTENGRGFLREYKHIQSRYDNAQKMLDLLEYERDRLSELCKGYGFNQLKSIIDLE